MADPERAALIKSYWHRYARDAFQILSRDRVFRCPVTELTQVSWDLDAPPPAPAPTRYLEFVMQFGYEHGQKLWRVMCEGVQVAIGPVE